MTAKRTNTAGLRAFAKGECGRFRVSPRFLKIRDNLASRWGGFELLDAYTAEIVSAAAAALHRAERSRAERTANLNSAIRLLSLLEPAPASQRQRRVHLPSMAARPVRSLQEQLAEARAARVEQ